MSEPSKTTFTFKISKRNIGAAMTRYYSRLYAFATSSPLALALSEALGTSPNNVYAVHTNSEVFVIVYKNMGEEYEEMFRLVTKDDETLTNLLRLHDTFLEFVCYQNGPAPKGGLTVTLTKL